MSKQWIKDIISIIPLDYDNYKIKLLSECDLDWYAYNVLEPYFNEFLDNKATNKYTVKDIKRKLEPNITGKETESVRLIIEKDSKNIGGITFIKTDNRHVYQIGYWINPNYQNMGIMTKALSTVIKNIKSRCIKELELVIQSDNLKSIKLANKLKFEHIYDINGAFKLNKVYRISLKENKVKHGNVFSTREKYI